MYVRPRARNIIHKNRTLKVRSSIRVYCVLSLYIRTRIYIYIYIFTRILGRHAGLSSHCISGRWPSSSKLYNVHRDGRVKFGEIRRTRSHRRPFYSFHGIHRRRHYPFSIFGTPLNASSVRSTTRAPSNHRSFSSNARQHTVANFHALSNAGFERPRSSRSY